MPNIFRIMFVCTGNTCRSPMAAGGLRKLLDNKNIKDVEVFSAGTAAAMGFPATAYAIEASKIWEADITNHRSQPLAGEIIDRADLILTMEPYHCDEVIRMRQEAARKTYLLKNYPEKGCSGESVDDPIGSPLDMYNQTFLEIGEELGRILPQIINAAENKAGEEA